MKNILFVAIALLFSLTAQAQIKRAELQVSGLTCSMCNLSVKKSLEKIPFIKSIKADVETATYQIAFSDNRVIAFADIQNAVKRAGFSVAKLSFTSYFNNLAVAENTQINLGGSSYYVVASKTKTLQGEVAFQIVDKGFMLDKDFKKYQAKLKSSTEKPLINVVQL